MTNSSFFPVTPEVNPVGPYTPECSESMNLARTSIQSSHVLVKEVIQLVDQCVKVQKDIHLGVNDGLTKKASESVAMKVP